MSRGIVPLQDYLDLYIAHDGADPLPQPKDWCGGINGPGIRVYEEKYVRHILGSIGFAAPEGEQPHVQMSWQQTYAEDCAQFHDKVLPELEKLGDPENTRIVFGFDS